MQSYILGLSEGFYCSSWSSLYLILYFLQVSTFGWGLDHYAVILFTLSNEVCQQQPQYSQGLENLVLLHVIWEQVFCGTTLVLFSLSLLKISSLGYHIITFCLFFWLLNVLGLLVNLLLSIYSSSSSFPAISRLLVCTL